MNELPTIYKGYRFPAEVISHAVWLYHRFTLSFRDIEEILFSRGIDVTFESISQWCLKLAPAYSKRRKQKPNRGTPGDIWHLDEVFIKIKGEPHYLWRAVDQDGDVIDILVQKKRNTQAAKRFFRKLLKKSGVSPNQIITDNLRSYGAAHRELNMGAIHVSDKYRNNRAENSHQRTRQQERQMRWFKSAGYAQRFLSMHGMIHNIFNLGRHLNSARCFRELRVRAFSDWKDLSQVAPNVC